MKEAFAIYSSKVEFVPNVLSTRYRLFQAADVISMLELVKAKLSEIGSMTESENRFFGGAKNFREEKKRDEKTERIEEEFFQRGKTRDETGNETWGNLDTEK